MLHNKAVESKHRKKIQNHKAAAAERDEERKNKHKF